MNYLSLSSKDYIIAEDVLMIWDTVRPDEITFNCTHGHKALTYILSVSGDLFASASASRTLLKRLSDVDISLVKVGVGAYVKFEAIRYFTDKLTPTLRDEVKNAKDKKKLFKSAKKVKTYAFTKGNYILAFEFTTDTIKRRAKVGRVK